MPRKVRSTREFANYYIPIFFRECFRLPQNLSKSEFCELNLDDKISLITAIVERYRKDEDYISDYDIELLMRNILWYTLNYSRRIANPEEIWRIQNNFNLKDFPVSEKELEDQVLQFNSEKGDEKDFSCIFFEEKLDLSNGMKRTIQLYKCINCPCFVFSICEKVKFLIQKCINLNKKSWEEDECEKERKIKMRNYLLTNKIIDEIIFSKNLKISNNPKELYDYFMKNLYSDDKFLN